SESKLQLIFDTNVQAGLLLPPRVSNQASHQVDQAVSHTAMTSVLYLRDVLELIHHRFDDGPLAKHDLVEDGHQSILHSSLEFRHELDAFPIEQIEERLRDVALVAEEIGRAHV